MGIQARTHFTRDPTHHTTGTMELRRAALGIAGIALCFISSGCGNARTDQPTAVPAPPVTTSPPAAPDHVHQCPACKQVVPADAKYCLRCGSRLR